MKKQKKHRQPKRRKPIKAHMKAPKGPDNLTLFMKEWRSVSEPDYDWWSEQMSGEAMAINASAETRAKDGVSVMFSETRYCGEKYAVVGSYSAGASREGVRLMRFLCELADYHKTKLGFCLSWGRETRALLRFGFKNHRPERFEDPDYEDQHFVFIRPPNDGKLSVVDIKYSIKTEEVQKHGRKAILQTREIKEDPDGFFSDIEKVREAKRLNDEQMANNTIPRQVYVRNRDMYNQRIRDLEADQEEDEDLKWVLGAA